MHLVDAEHGFMGATGVVGGSIPIALGSALAARLRSDDAVAVVFFGDGAVQAGHFNETVNLAALWKLPADPGVREQRIRGVHAALGTYGWWSASAMSSRPTNVERATVDGNDVPAVWDAFGGFLDSAPAARARSCRVPDPAPAAATTRAIRAPTARRSRRTTGRRRTRSCGSSAMASRRLVRRGRTAGHGGGPRRPSRRRCASARESPFPPAGLIGGLVYADG